MNNEATPNPAQAHASLSTTGTARTLATLGYAFDAATAALILQAIGGAVRFTLNGIAPSTSFGLLLADGDMVELGINEANVARFITASGNPKLEIAAFIQ